MPRNALVMPKMSMTMEVGTMVFWLKTIGDSVTAGEPICEVTTDKVDMEVEATSTGTLVEICAEQGDIIEVGEPIAFIDSEDEDLLAGLFGPRASDTTSASGVDSAAGASSGPDHEPRNPTASTAPTLLTSSSISREVLAVPAARALAVQHGVDIARVEPTGKWSTVKVSDVQAYLEAGAGIAAGAGQQPVTKSISMSDVNTQPSNLATTFSLSREFQVSESEVVELTLARIVRGLSRALRSNPFVLRDDAGQILPDITIAVLREHIQIGNFTEIAHAVSDVQNPENHNLDSLAQRIANPASPAVPVRSPMVALHSMLGTGVTRVSISPRPDAVFTVTVADVVTGSNRAEIGIAAAHGRVPLSIAANILAQTINLLNVPSER